MRQSTGTPIAERNRLANLCEKQQRSTTKKRTRLNLYFGEDKVGSFHVVENLIPGSQLDMGMFETDADKTFYFEEQWALLEAQLHKLKKPNSDVVFEASTETIRGYKEKLHSLIFKYGIKTPNDAAMIAISKRIDDEAQAKLRAGKSPNPEGLKMSYYYGLQNWAAARGMPPLAKRRFAVPIRAGTEYVYTPREVQTLIANAGNDRDRALLAVAAGTGLRRRELRFIRVDDLEPDGVNVRDHGQQLKTKSERFAPFMQGTEKHVDKWLSTRARYLAEKSIDDCGWLFITEQGGQMADETIYSIIKKLKDAEGIRTRGTVHAMRRYMVTTYGQNDVDMGKVQLMTGHHRIETLRRYQRYSVDDVKKAAKKVRLC